MRLATAEQMRRLDGQTVGTYRIPSLDLMERAAQGLCAAALEMLPNRAGKCRVSVLCGNGNNGGDGIAAARLLFLRGVKIRAFLVEKYEKLTPDALAMTGKLSECGIELEPFSQDSAEQKSWIFGSDLLIDALFGIGLSQEISPDSSYFAAVEWMNAAPGTVLAADIASGVAADTGNILGCAVKADRTITFTLPKVGQFVGKGNPYSGKVDVWDIGIPHHFTKQLVCSVQTIEADYVKRSIPPRKPDGHKGDFGKLLIVGGSAAYTGAPYLTAAAAERSGCGMIFMGVPQSIWAVEAGRCTGAMPLSLPEIRSRGMLSYKALQKIEETLSACEGLAIGPGLGRDRQITELVCKLLRRTKKPVVLDADGINALEGHMDVLDARQGSVTILTPHDGEFARLGGDLSGGDRIGTARAFAREHGCILVLKGHNTIIACPQGNVMVNTTGNSGLSKGGSGDILTGVIASLLCQGATAVQAAACGVWLHGCAGDLAAEELSEYGMTPADVTASLPAAFQTVMKTE